MWPILAVGVIARSAMVSVSVINETAGERLFMIIFRHTAYIMAMYRHWPR